MLYTSCRRAAAGQRGGRATGFSSLSWDPRSSRWRGRSPSSGYRSLSPWVCSGLGSKRMEGTNLEFPPQPPRVRRPPACFRTRTEGLLELTLSTPAATGSQAVLGPGPEPLRQGRWEDGGPHSCSGVLRVLAFFPDWPATVYFPEASSSYRMHSAGFQSCFVGRDGLCVPIAAPPGPEPTMSVGHSTGLPWVPWGRGRGSCEQAFTDGNFSLALQETPTKELGRCGGDAHGPELNSPAPSSGSPYLSRCINSESSTDEEGTSLHCRV